MSEGEPTVFVVDDDPSVRRSTERLVRSMGFDVITFASATEFKNRRRVEGPACLVLDVHLPDLSGLDLQRELAASGVEMPIIFITGRGSIPMSVRAMKEGAVEFLTKPVRSRDLLAAIRAAIERDRASQLARRETYATALAVRTADRSRARGLGAGRLWPSEQADRRRARDVRTDGQVPSRAHHGEDAGPIARGARPHGRAPRDRPTRVTHP